MEDAFDAAVWVDDDERGDLFLFHQGEGGGGEGGGVDGEGVGFMISPAVWSRARLPSRSRRRRRSPSEIMPRSCASASRTVVMPSFLRDIS